MRHLMRQLISPPRFHAAALLAIVPGFVLLLLSGGPVFAQEAVFVDSGQAMGAESSMAVALGDLDGDGDLDAFVGNAARQADRVWLNDGHGIFRDSGQRLGLLPARDVALADLDGDGDLDAFVANADGQPDTVWINDGAASFADSGQRLGDWSSMGVALGDVDGDGDFDAYVATANSQPDVLWLNDGSGYFTDSGQRLGTASGRDVALGDLNGDGELDAFVANSQGPSSQPAQVWINVGGVFSDSGQTFGDFTANAVALADLNGNGSLDAFIANGTGNRPAPNLVWFNDGTGKFTDSDQRLGSPATNTSAALALGDVDGDGDVDAYTANDAGSEDAVWLNGGGGQFTPAAPIAMRYFTVGVALGDLDGDGRLDVFAANRPTQPNQVLFNTGTVRYKSSDPVLGAAGAQDVAFGDVNGDGNLDAVLATGTAEGKGDHTLEIWLNDSHNGIVDSGQHLGDTTGQGAALGDLDGDGDLDAFLVTGAPGAALADQVWRNDGSGGFTDTGQRLDESFGQDVALGDLDGDGDLDAFVANGTGWGTSPGSPEPNTVWINDGGGVFSGSGQQLGNGDSRGVALGDVDGDGDLDAMVANAGGEASSELWLNDGAGQFVDGGQLLLVSDARAVALGDLDGDGDLDAFFANGFWNQPNYVFLNDGLGNFVDSEQRLGTANAFDVALGDVDGDGDLDAFVSRVGAETLWLNTGSAQFREVSLPQREDESAAVALGDLNGDGALDALVADNAGQGAIWLNQSAGNGRVRLAVTRPGPTQNANFYSSPAILDNPIIPISYTISLQPGGQAHQLALYYSSNGGGKWLPASIAGSQDANGVDASGAIDWDVRASAFFGSSDNVELRLVIREQFPSAAVGSYRYTNTVAGPYQWLDVASTTFPFRVRGQQVRVVDEAGAGVAGALVFRRAKDEAGIAQTMADAVGRPFTTDANGYLRGHGALAPGDQLVALAPITSTQTFVLYHTSAAPNAIDLSMDTVSISGIQELKVSAAHPLMLFDLDIALEWDARADGTFMDDLETAIKNASAILYDISDGQVALGQVRVHQAKENWPWSDVVIYASSSMRPRASMGGIVRWPVDDTGLMVSGDGTIQRTIHDAYVPGQVRMGPLWDPFGQSDAELRQDWWLAFAHELAHYLLFLPDNYLGVADGYMQQIDCQRSFMTSTYEESYREFLTRDDWDAQKACAGLSVAAHTTGRSDWETITTVYPWLQAPASAAAVNSGPATLPLAVTRVVEIDPTPSPAVADVMPARYYDLRTAEGGELARLRQAKGYLIKRQQTPGVLEDDTMIALGSTALGSDRIKVRGAAQGDRLCVIDAGSDPQRIGCRLISGSSTSISLTLVSGWHPNIVVSAITSRTLAVTVTQPMSAGVELNVQAFPAYGSPAQTLPIYSPVAVLQSVDEEHPLTFTQVITLDYPSFEGFVRVWVPGGRPTREAMSQFFVSGAPALEQTEPLVQAEASPEARSSIGLDQASARALWIAAGGWGPNSPGNRGGSDARALEILAGGWGPNSPGNRGGADTRAQEIAAGGWGPNSPGNRGGANARAWGASHRSLEAPVASGDGHVTIFNVEDIFGDPGAASLQALDFLPNLPTWMTPIGAGYRFAATTPLTRTIAFQYLDREVPKGYEFTLSIYFLPSNGSTWQRLPTRLDPAQNLAVARMPDAGLGQGVYALIAAVEMPALQPGWNLFAYTIPETRTVEAALASIKGGYTSVYYYEPALKTWQVYDSSVTPSLKEVVNTLQTMELGQSYLIYATKAITPYLAVGSIQSGGPGEVNTASAPQLPPATYYGKVVASAAFRPAKGMVVQAQIDGQTCGESALQALHRALVYQIQVAAASENGSCGAPGAEVTFRVAGEATLYTSTWDNQRAWRHDLIMP